jgi:hypothetical protein
MLIEFSRVTAALANTPTKNVEKTSSKSYAQTEKDLQQRALRECSAATAKLKTR